MVLLLEEWKVNSPVMKTPGPEAEKPASTSATVHLIQAT